VPSDYGNRPGDGPLRLNGQAVADILQPGDLPSTVSEAAERQQPAVTLLRDVVAGPERIRDAGSAYLPQAPGEDPKNYRARLLRSVFANFTGRTLEGLVGQVFRVDPLLSDDVPATIKTQWENIDLAGTHGDVFLRALFQDALTSGHTGILVEYPKTEGTQDHAAERSGAVRPYWVPIKKEDILSWRTAVINGQTVLTQLVLKECTMVPAGRFGEKEQTRYRVFTREHGVVAFELLEIADDKKTVIQVDAGTYPTQEEIPFAEIVTSGRQSILDSKPPARTRRTTERDSSAPSSPTSPAAPSKGWWAKCSASIRSSRTTSPPRSRRSGRTSTSPARTATCSSARCSRTR
jgi:hypothetical protein